MRRFNIPVIAVIALFALNNYSFLEAHEVLKKYIHHNIVMYVGPDNIDIELALEFYENNSLKERQLMDVDQNGKISKAEIDKYLATLSGQFENDLKLFIDNKEIELLPLYNPRLEFRKNNLVAPTTHIIRLTYFARTPKSFSPGSEIDLRDSFWPSIPLISRFNVMGKDGIDIVVKDRDSGSATTAKAGEKDRLFRATCIKGRNG